MERAEAACGLQGGGVGSSEERASTSCSGILVLAERVLRELQAARDGFVLARAVPPGERTRTRVQVVLIQLAMTERAEEGDILHGHAQQGQTHA